MCEETIDGGNATMHCRLIKTQNRIQPCYATLLLAGKIVSYWKSYTVLKATELLEKLLKHSPTLPIYCALDHHKIS